MLKKCLFSISLVLFVVMAYAQVSIESTVNTASLSFFGTSANTSRIAYTWLLPSDATIPQSSTVLLQQSKACVKYNDPEIITSSLIANLNKKTDYVLAYITIDALGNPTSGMYTTNFTTASEPVIYDFSAVVAGKRASLNITADRVGKVYLLASQTVPEPATVVANGAYAGDISEVGTSTTLSNVLVSSIPSDVLGTYFYLFAVVENPDGSQSMYAYSDLFASTAVNNEIRDNKVNLLPNPASTSTTITYILNESTNVKIEIYDAAGKFVKRIENGLQTVGTHQKTVEVGDLANGAYVCRLRTAKNTVSRTLIIRR